MEAYKPRKILAPYNVRRIEHLLMSSAGLHLWYVEAR